MNLMRFLLQPFRFLAVILSLFGYLLNMALVWCFVFDRWQRVRWSNRILKRYCRFGLWVLNVNVNLVGEQNVRPLGHGQLVVGNHLSYLDVLVIHSLVPACFVTSQEIRETPVLGQVCLLAGCLFVERRKKTAIKNEISEIAQGLREGLNVAIFPEATSTNGEQILRFRRPLYLAAIEAAKPVVPFCLNYREVGSLPINRSTRDSVFWYGDMDFASHLWRLAGSGGVNVDLVFLPALVAGPQDDAAILAERSQKAVESVFCPVLAEPPA